MGDAALKRWMAIRQLYENWGVPFDILSLATALKQPSLKRKASSEGWFASSGAAALHASMARSFEDQLDRLNDPNSGLDEEKRTRALSLMAKALEPIVGIASKVGVKSKTDTSDNQKESGTDGPDAQRDANRVAELDNQIEALVKGLAH